jgi:hypothetical protein
MSTSSGAPRPRQNCEPPNQGRKSPVFTPVSAITPLPSGIYGNAIRLGISSKHHFTPSDMSQAVNLSCSPLLHHQLVTIIETACGLAVSGSAFPQPPCVDAKGVPKTPTRTNACHDVSPFSTAPLRQSCFSLAASPSDQDRDGAD